MDIEVAYFVLNYKKRNEKNKVRNSEINNAGKRKVIVLN